MFPVKSCASGKHVSVSTLRLWQSLHRFATSLSCFPLHAVPGAFIGLVIVCSIVPICQRWLTASRRVRGGPRGGGRPLGCLRGVGARLVVGIRPAVCRNLRAEVATSKRSGVTSAFPNIPCYYIRTIFFSIDLFGLCGGGGSFSLRRMVPS